jgi:hypothetical protein
MQGKEDAISADLALEIAQTAPTSDSFKHFYRFTGEEHGKNYWH